MTNNSHIPLPIAVWLATDNYDHQDDPNYISATSIIRPLRQIVLSMTQKVRAPNILDLVSASIGTSIHDAIEKSWENPEKALIKLGFDSETAKRFKINPVQPNEDDIPVYVERRTTKQVAGYTVGGKFDIVVDGVLYDYKSTSVYVSESRWEDYRLQGSIYRWLNPEIIKSDFVRICFVYLDWKMAAKDNNNYPQNRVEYKDIPLLSLSDTEHWLVQRLTQLTEILNNPSMLPECNDRELWRDPAVFKYYLDPAKTTRSTKNFLTLEEANAYCNLKGRGVVLVKPSEPRRCGYCSVSEHCSQYKQMVEIADIES